jgi:hypothetical protein
VCRFSYRGQEVHRVEFNDWEAELARNRHTAPRVKRPTKTPTGEVGEGEFPVLRKTVTIQARPR